MMRKLDSIHAPNGGERVRSIVFPLAGSGVSGLECMRRTIDSCSGEKNGTIGDYKQDFFVSGASSLISRNASQELALLLPFGLHFQVLPGGEMNSKKG